MVAGVRSSVDFSTSHRVTYSPWRNLDFAKDDKKFLKKKGNTKTKLFELNVSSEFLVIDDYPGINSSDIKKIKNNEKKSDYDRFKIKEKFIFPVKKKNYPVYLYHSNKSERETIEEIKNVENKDQSPAMFPILSIEGIENCRLQKSFDSSLIFESDKNKFRGAGNNFWGQVDTMKEDKITDFHLKICQLDFGDFSDIDVLKSVTQYSVVPKKLTLRHFRHINNWKILHKFFDLEEIHFDNCKINLEGKKKNDWFDIMSKFSYNRKNNKELNDKYGDLKVFVNGQEVFE